MTRRSLSTAVAACVLMAVVAVDAVAHGDDVASIDGRPIRVLIAGDSTALLLGDGMVVWAADHPEELHVEQAAGIGCGLNPVGGNVDNPFAEQCAERLQLLPTRVASLRPDVVLAMVTVPDLEARPYPGLGTVTMSDPAFFEHLRAGYEEQTAQLLDAGAGLVVWVAPAMPPYPRLGWWADALDPEVQSSYRSVLDGLAESIDGVVVADFAAWMDAQADPPERYDGLHLSAAGAYDATERYFAPLIAALVTTAS